VVISHTGVTGENFLAKTSSWTAPYCHDGPPRIPHTTYTIDMRVAGCIGLAVCDLLLTVCANYVSKQLI